MWFDELLGAVEDAYSRVLQMKTGVARGSDGLLKLLGELRHQASELHLPERHPDGVLAALAS